MTEDSRHELNDRSMVCTQSEKQREYNLNNKNNKINIASLICRPITKELCFVFFQEMATQVWPQKETQERHRKKFIILTDLRETVTAFPEEACGELSQPSS